MHINGTIFILTSTTVSISPQMCLSFQRSDDKYVEKHIRFSTSFTAFDSLMDNEFKYQTKNKSVYNYEFIEFNQFIK